MVLNWPRLIDLSKFLQQLGLCSQICGFELAISPVSAVECDEGSFRLE